MADNYTIEGYTQTTELSGGNKIVPVREYRVRTKPSGIYFQFRRPKAKWAPSNIASVADQFATRIEAVLASPNVIDMVYFQDVTQGGMLLDMFEVFYASDDQEISGSIEVKLKELGPNATPPLVATELNEGGAFLAL